MIRLRQKSEKKHEQSASNNKKKSDSTDETTNIAAEMTCAFKSVSNSKKNKKNVKKNIKNIKAKYWDILRAPDKGLASKYDKAILNEVIEHFDEGQIKKILKNNLTLTKNVFILIHQSFNLRKLLHHILDIL